MADRDAQASFDAERTMRLHLRIGWWGLLLFLSLGAFLELLHALKAGFYLDVANDARRLMWRLAHAHGALLSLVNVAFALSLGRWRTQAAARLPLASGCLAGATLIIPGGFFGAGLFVHGGDPGLGVLIVPAGAVLLFVAVLLTARSLER